MTWAVPHADGVMLSLRVVPRASRSEVAGGMGDVLRVKVKAPPVEGKANKALVKLLADRLGVPVRAVQVMSGEASRNKRVFVGGITAGEAVRALLEDPA